jgi:hypothetical protein
MNSTIFRCVLWRKQIPQSLEVQSQSGSMVDEGHISTDQWVFGSPDILRVRSIVARKSRTSKALNPRTDHGYWCQEHLSTDLGFKIRHSGRSGV